MRRQSKNIKPLVSIIIPCRNEENFIAACLDSILANDYPKNRREIFIVDGLSQDKTRLIVKSYAQNYKSIRLLDNPRKITPAALNIGLGRATGDIIVRMDAHTLYPPHYISELIRWLEKSKADNVGCAWRIRPADDSPKAQAIAAGLAHPWGIGNALYRLGTDKPKRVDTVPFGCYRKDVFTRIGTFDEELIRNQDDEFNLRLIKNKGKILLVPGLVCYYYAKNTLSQLWSTYYQYGYYKPLVARKVGGIQTVRQLVPAAFLLSLLSSAAALPWSQAARIVFSAIVLMYLTLNITFSAQTAIQIRKRRPKTVFGWLLLVFPTLHVSYGLGFLKGTVDFRGDVAHWAMKRSLDLIASFIGLLLLSPLFLLLALGIKLGSKGPVLFRQRRMGKDFKPFWIYKFRTMVHNAPRLGAPLTSGNDPRITRWGRFLRRTKLDELPQLINVLKGEMSLIGPRPEISRYVEMFRADYAEILKVPPGITDLASVKYHDEAKRLGRFPAPEKEYIRRILPEKIRLAKLYLSKASLAYDMTVLAKTALALVLRSHRSWMRGPV